MNAYVLKPHHFFQDRGKQFVLDVQDMKISAIDTQVADILAQLERVPDSQFEPSIREKLHELGLLAKRKANTDTTSRKNFSKNSTSVSIATLLVTQSCNLRCAYCYGKYGSNGMQGRMKKETALQAVDWLLRRAADKKQILVNFSGGEPFLSFPLMQQTVEYACKRGKEENKRVKFHVDTNGTLLDSESIAFIQEHNISLKISVDGPREVHDANRPFADGSGSYETVVQNCKKLLEIKPETQAHAVITGSQTPLLMKEALYNIGFRNISARLSSTSLFAGEVKINKSARDTRPLIQELEQEANLWLTHTQTRDRQSLEVLKCKSQLYGAITSLLNNRKRRRACVAGLGVVTIASNGDVYPCHRFVGTPEYRLGSIFREKMGRELYQKSVDLNERCVNCFAKYYCGGGCMHDNAASSGSIDHPAEDMCRIKRRELELAARVVGNLNKGNRDYLIEQGVFPAVPWFM